MAVKIIARYLGKEVLGTMLLITTVAVFIFLCNQVVRYLSYAASGKYAVNMLFHLILYHMPILFALLLPLGFYLGILMGYGRLYADSEMTVLMACGLSRRQLLKMTMGFAVLVAILVGLLVLWINPIMSKQRDRMMDLAESSTIFQTIMPGRFQSSAGGDKVFYAQGLSLNRHSMENIFVAQRIKGNNRWSIVSAKEGYEKIDKKTQEHYFVARDGYRYDGIPGQQKFRLTRYGTYGLRMKAPVFSGHNEGEEALSTGDLLKQLGDNNYMAELQWRLSMPLSVLILGLLAFPLSRVNPRQGRFAQIIPSVFIYIIYANMLFVARTWLEAGTIPAWLGLWWVHGLVLWLAIVLLMRNPVVSARAPFYSRWLSK